MRFAALVSRKLYTFCSEYQKKSQIGESEHQNAGKSKLLRRTARGLAAVGAVGHEDRRRTGADELARRGQSGAINDNRSLEGGERNRRSLYVTRRG